MQISINYVVNSSSFKILSFLMSEGTRPTFNLPIAFLCMKTKGDIAVLSFTTVSHYFKKDIRSFLFSNS